MISFGANLTGEQQLVATLFCPLLANWNMVIKGSMNLKGDWVTRKGIIVKFFLDPFSCTILRD